MSVDADQLGQMASRVSDTSLPEQAAVLREQRARVHEALTRLDASQRQAIELAYYEGLTHSQIAERLQSPLGTVKTWIRQGIIRLRDTLNTPMDETGQA